MTRPRCDGSRPGSPQDAVDVLVELAGECEDFGELRRLAELGSSDAADVLAELRE